VSAETFLARLDNAPLNRFHWRLLAVSGVGVLLDAMDVLLIGFLLVPIRGEFGLDSVRIGLIASAGFAGMFLGAAFFGRLADRYGRRSVVQATLVLFSIGSLLSAAAPSFELLLGARLVAGLGLGGELPVVSTLVSELAPRASRGRLVVLLGSFWVYGAVAAGLVAVFALPLIGWRGAFIIGAVPALYVAYLRRALPESPRYLAEHGRAAEADAIVRRVEREGGGALITVARPVAPPRSSSARVGDLFSGRSARRTGMLWILWFGMGLTYSGMFVFIPAWLVERGPAVTQGNELFFGSTLAQLPGYWTAAWLVERAGRKATLILFLVGAAVSAVGFGSTGLGPDGTATAPGAVWAAALSFFDLGLWGVGYAFAAELYPTAIRGTATGAAVAVGRLGGIAAPLVVIGIVAAAGQLMAFGVLAGLLLLAAGAVLLLAEETRGRSLEELAPAV